LAIQVEAGFRNFFDRKRLVERRPDFGGNARHTLKDCKDKLPIFQRRFDSTEIHRGATEFSLDASFDLAPLAAARDRNVIPVLETRDIFATDWENAPDVDCRYCDPCRDRGAN
jgi:hypothetical protein